MVIRSSNNRSGVSKTLRSLSGSLSTPTNIWLLIVFIYLFFLHFRPGLSLFNMAVQSAVQSRSGGASQPNLPNLQTEPKFKTKTHKTTSTATTTTVRNTQRMTTMTKYMKIWLQTNLTLALPFSIVITVIKEIIMKWEIILQIV